MPAGFSCNSYLTLIYTEAVEIELVSLLFEIETFLKNKNFEINVTELDPQNNKNSELESKCNIGCMKDPDYFRIRHVKIELTSNQSEHHNLF